MDRGEPTVAPYGFCHCGCGRKTKLAPQSHTRLGWTKGEPIKFIVGHATRRQTPNYEIRDCGYETPCWVWLGESVARFGNHYGRVWRDNRRIMAHRLMYEQHIGPIPGGMQLDHLCRVTLCVNPDHLEPVTSAENRRRSPKTKLNLDIARVIRASEQSSAALARQFSVSPSTIRDIRTGHSWKDVA